MLDAGCSFWTLDFGLRTLNSFPATCHSPLVTISGEIDAIEADAQFLGGQGEAAAHELAEILSRGDEQGDIRGAFSQGFPTGGAGRLSQGVQKIIFALELANHGAVKLGFEPASQANEQRRGQTNHVRTGLSFEPRNELVE